MLTTMEIKGLENARTGTADCPDDSGLENAGHIHYWGHYPVADIEYEIDAPVSAGVRAWSPFIPGDLAISNTPGAVFEVHLRNVSDSDQLGTIAMSFPGPSLAETCGSTHFVRRNVEDAVSGIYVTNVSGNEYVLGVIGSGPRLRIGGDIGTDGGGWSRIAAALPAALTGRDVSGPAKPGGLVDRIIQAGNSAEEKDY